MKQQVNLLLLLPKFEKRLFSLPMLLFCDVLLVIFLLIVYLPVRLGLDDKRDILIKEQSAHQIAEVKLFETEKQFSREERISAFNQKAVDLNKEIAEKTELVAILSSGRSKNITGFSRYLEELGNEIIPGIALSEIAVSEGGKSITLEGQAISTDVALAFAKRLDHDTVFAGQTFKLSQLGKSSQHGYLNIRLSNAKDDGKGESR
ncbi:MAG: hypothetical protein GY821_14575 [Gammaproteobacteria bacterium]|nr:hypothetical protein [Gammaproteobacteria bacterium]